MLVYNVFFVGGSVGELRYHAHFAIQFYVDFFPPKRTKSFASVINRAASAPQGIILAFCGKDLRLKPGVSVGFDQRFNYKLEQFSHV